MTRNVTNYLQTGRLADVLALLQFLAFDESGYRSEQGLLIDLGRKPISSDSWTNVAQSHPEFFRVRDVPGKTVRVALIIRYTVGKIEIVDGEERRPPLKPELATTFFNLAIDLHDKQVANRDRWKPWVIAFAVALLGAIATIVAASLKMP